MPNMFNTYNDRKDHPKIVAYQKRKIPERKLSLSGPAVGIVMIVIIASVGWFKIIRLTKCKARQVLKTPKNKTKPNAQGEASRMKAPNNIKNWEDNF